MDYLLMDANQHVRNLLFVCTGEFPSTMAPEASCAAADSLLEASDWSIVAENSHHRRALVLLEGALVSLRYFMGSAQKVA